MKPELKHRLVNIGSAVLAGAGSLVSPGLTASDPAFLQGDGSNNHLRVLLIGQNGTTLPMLEEVKEDIFSISPMDEFRSITDVAGILGGNELGCDQNAQCDWEKVNEVIKGYLARGLVFHETMVVIKSNDEGGAGQTMLPLPSHLVRPDIYTPSAIARPVDTRLTRVGNAGTVVHEFLHAFAGFDHEGNDIMQRVCNCINAQHARFLRSLKLLVPFNYQTPKNGINAAAGSLSLKADLITPAGTIQQKRWITPANNDGPDITLLRNPESSFTVPAPQMGVGNYILLPDMTYTWTEWSSGYPTALSWNAPQWDNFEGWPGVFFPNTPSEIKIHTPKRFSDGITAVSPRAGEVVNTSNPTLVWANRDGDVFYYEIQSSKDCSFNTDPQTATASVIWELRHGGVTNPLNSYTVPGSARLELGTEYCWRVRPRIQGDGTSVPWSETFRFSTPATLKSLSEYSDSIYGWKPDTDLGNSAFTASAEDMKRFGKPI